VALALYRKYRPATFAEVMGQEHVTEPLMKALRAGRINHAYLFSGPRGCGKTSCARILARSLNCEKGPTPEPCGACDSCVALAPDGPGSLDVIEIDAASHGGVDDARDLRERAFFAPVSSRYKVYIVDEAHMVSTQGFNALLKLVEEPPDFLVFVFATTEPDKVLQTIRSRTHHYPFRLIPPGVMRGLLERICAAEDVTVERSVLSLVVRAGAGSARDAESLLDQLLAGAGPEGVTYAEAVGLLGVTDAALLDEILDALAAGDGATAYETVDRVVEAGHDPRRFAVDLLERLRDLVVLDAVPDAAAKSLIDGPADQIERMTGQAARLGTATLSRLADIVHTGLVEMRGTTSPRLLLELLCARMLLPAASGGGAALLQRLERLERRLSIATPEGGGVAQPPRPAERAHGAEGPPGQARTRPGSRSRGAGGADAASGGAGPGGVGPGGPATGGAGPGGAGSEGPAPGVSRSGDAGSGRAGSGGADAPSGPMSGGAAPGSPVPGGPVSGGPGSGRPRSGRAGSGGVDAPSGGAGSGGAGSGGAGSAGPAPGDPGSGRVGFGATGAGSGGLGTGGAGVGSGGAEVGGIRPAGGAGVAGTRGAPTGGDRGDEVGIDSAVLAQDSPVGGPASLDTVGVRQKWPEVLDVVKRHRRTTHALLMNASVHSVADGVLILAISTPPLSRLLADEVNMSSVRGAVRDVLGVDWQVRVVVDGGTEPATSTAARATAPSPPEDDPRDDDDLGQPGDPAGSLPTGQRADTEQTAISLLESRLGARRMEPDG
jgi:DNA polymerase-3 subunit gamma/tau